MKSNDPASLQNLNDIVLPASVEWWPLASGWYFLFALLLFAVVWYGYKAVRGWFANRYRREALKELVLLKEAVQSDSDVDTRLRQLPVLLKRTALAAYPRDQVASLSGNDWFRFLNSTLSTPVFTESDSLTLEQISYSVGKLSVVEPRAATELIASSENWISHHQPFSHTNEGAVR